MLSHNRDSKNPPIALKGIMVGNGVMNFEDHSLDKSEIQYMIDHDIVSNRLETIYHQACTADYTSPRCRFVLYELDILEAYLNPYSTLVAKQISTRSAATAPARASGSRKCSR